MRLALSLLLILCFSASAAEAKRHPCRPNGSKTEAHDADGRVYSVKAAYGDRSYFACLYRSGLTRTVGTYDGFDDQLLHIEIASPFVAFSSRDVSSQGSADGLERLNVATGRRRGLELAAQGQIRRFFITSSGATVWFKFSGGAFATGEIK